MTHRADHQFHRVCLDNGKTMLNGREIKEGEHLSVMFEDGHVDHGHVITQCCHNEPHPHFFIPIKYHGKAPWILLNGLRARHI